jgi:hypothetical protein
MWNNIILQKQNYFLYSDSQLLHSKNGLIANRTLLAY